MILKMQQDFVYDGTVIANYREICQKMLFVLRGSVQIYVYNEEKNEKYPFLVLKAGSSANVVTTLLEQETLFIMETSEDSLILSLTKDDIE